MSIGVLGEDGIIHFDDSTETGTCMQSLTQPIKVTDYVSILIVSFALVIISVALCFILCKVNSSKRKTHPRRDRERISKSPKVPRERERREVEETGIIGEQLLSSNRKKHHRSHNSRDSSGSSRSAALHSAGSPMYNRERPKFIAKDDNSSTKRNSFSTVEESNKT